MRTQISIKEAAKLKLQIREDDVANAVNLAKVVSAYYPAEAMVNVTEYDDKFHYGHMEVKLQHEFLDLRISFGYTKKYDISCMSLTFKNLSGSTVYGHKFEKPNQIGVLNEKKILQWVNYYEQVYQRAAELDKASAAKKELFLLSLKGLPVKWFGTDKRRGSIIKNGIEYSFNIGDEGVSQKIELHYKIPSTLAAFKLLSDNKWK